MNVDLAEWCRDSYRLQASAILALTVAYSICQDYLDNFPFVE